MRDGKDDDEEEQEGERERWDDCVDPPGDVRVTLGGRAGPAFAEEKVRGVGGGGGGGFGPPDEVGRAASAFAERERFFRGGGGEGGRTGCMLTPRTVHKSKRAMNPSNCLGDKKKKTDRGFFSTNDVWIYF